MTPFQIILLISSAIVIFNILTYRFRERKVSRHEARLNELAKRKGELTLKDISEELDIPLHDAKILARKFVSKEKMELRKNSGTESYVFKSRP